MSSGSARGGRRHLGEEVADAGGADADKHLDELRARDGEEGHARLPSARRKQSPPAPGSPSAPPRRGSAPGPKGSRKSHRAVVAVVLKIVTSRPQRIP